MPRQSLLATNQQHKLIAPKPGTSTGIPSSTSTRFELINGRLIAYDDNLNNYIIKGYNINDVIYSIVGLICDKIRVARWGVYTVEDESAYKQLQIIQSRREWKGAEYVKAVNLHHKALKPVADAGKWGELTQWANEATTFNDHVADMVAWKLITGNFYQWANILKGGVNAGTPYELDALPAQWTSIISNNKFPARALGYYNSIVPGIKYDTTQVLHCKDRNLNWDVNGNQLYGMSRMRAGLMRLKKNNSLTRAEAATFQNEGIKGLMFIDADPGVMEGVDTDIELDKLKEKIVGEWKGPDARGKIGVASQRMGYIPIGMTGEEMQMVESGMVDLRYFCNLFGGVPSQLLNDPENKVYSNMKEGEKALTSRCCLPHMISFRDSETMKARKDWGLKGRQVIDFDMTCYPELQADVKETAEWTAKMIAISPNEQRELCGLAALPDETLNEPWVLSMGRQPKSVYDQTAVDDALNQDLDTDSGGETGDS